MIELNNIKTRFFTVLCTNGLLVNSVNGRRVISGKDKKASFENSAPVECELAVPCYTSFFRLGDSKLIFAVLKAERVDGSGLLWKPIFRADFIPGKTKPIETGEHSAAYWLKEEGIFLIDNTLLEFPEEEKLSPIDCVRALWHKVYSQQHFASIDMHRFLIEWLEGKLDIYFDPVAGIKSQRFGLEIEFTGMTRRSAAAVLSDFFNKSFIHLDDAYDSYFVTDSNGGKWHIMRDSSISACNRDRIPTNSELFKCELVTPICSYEDIPLIQQIVRVLRRHGMMVNSSCGLHVHVDAEGHSAATLKNLANIMASKENLLFKALNIFEIREQYCQKIDRNFLENIQQVNGKNDLDDVKFIWYCGDDFSEWHYDSSRYHMLNLHSLWQGKGIEFRMFNSVTHAGKIKAYIQLCLAISNQAKQQNWVSFREKKTGFEKRQFRTWLIQMGLVGEEFATARLHLLANLSDEKTEAA